MSGTRRYVSTGERTKTIDDILGKTAPVVETEVLKVPSLSDDTSIDDLLKAGVQAVRGVMKAIMADVATGHPSRETIQNLKDTMGMLRDLKKEEKSFLDGLSDEELERLAKK